MNVQFAVMTTKFALISQPACGAYRTSPNPSHRVPLQRRGWPAIADRAGRDPRNYPAVLLPVKEVVPLFNEIPGVDPLLGQKCAHRGSDGGPYREAFG